MRKKKQPDKILLGTTGALLIIGIIALSSASIPESAEALGNTYGYFQHQLLYGIGVGLVAALAGYLIPHRKLKILALPLFLLTLLLLILVFVPGIGVGMGGARRWLEFGPLTVQPGEFLKLSFVLYLAAWLERRSKEKNNAGLIFPFLALLALVGVFFIFQPDISTLGVLAVTALVMFFLAGGKITHLLLAGTLLAGAGIALVQTSSYRLARIFTFFNPKEDPLGAGYQAIQALIAIGSGGLFGLGIGHSQLRYGLLPEPMADSIYAVWAEETGFLGSLLLIGLFMIFAWRGLRTAKSVPDTFGRFVAGGITGWIVIQAFVNIGAVSGLLPFTGIPLPFISYGGSAMVVNLAATGILLQLSRYITPQH